MALVISVVVSYFLYNRIKRQYAQNTQPVKIVAAIKPLDPGATITADAVALVDWPVSFPIEGAMTKTQDAVGRMVMFPVAAKEPIREALLAAPGSVGLAGKIPSGMRAVAVETNDVANVSGFLISRLSRRCTRIVQTSNRSKRRGGYSNGSSEYRGAQYW